ncbi:MAG: glycosyltransferase family 2 protein [Chitinophagaceae bacterium]|nr:glycosyltransferase family 2 protein [Chitinophagaceae bacterium]
MMIDIIVPTYNRPNDIEKFVSEIQKQNYIDYHVYIIDDCGKEPIENLIPKNSFFTYCRLNENKGQAFARNVAIGMGHGDIIVSLDDDAWFEDTDGLMKIQRYFAEYPQLGCLMFDVRTPAEDYLSSIHHIKENAALIGSHITCGCAYSRKAIDRIGGFGGFLHSGAEETDVTLKLIIEKFELRLAKNIKVFHNYVPSVRSKEWYRLLRFNTTRNDLLIVLMRYPLLKVIPYFLGKYFSHVYYSFKTSRDRFFAGLYTLMALPAAFFKFPVALKNRKALTNIEFANWIKIRW